MEDTNCPDAILVLEDGSIFRGKGVGKPGTTSGELCFNTAMTGYQEAFTDPSYFGQVLIMTNVHIGNYGVKHKESEHPTATVKGIICRNFNEGHSRPLADEELQKFLENSNVTGISGIDTRKLVKHIRSKGAMNAIISSETLDENKLLKILQSTPSMNGLELASKISTNKIYDLQTEDPGIRKVAVLDYGVKQNILRSLLHRGCQLRIFPAKSTFEEIKQWEPDGYFLSNGPGDPGAMDYSYPEIRKIIDSGKPVFGICLGHQLLCKAMEVNTYKMHHGHRGINHPVINLQTGKSEITSQNHGFGVEKAALELRSDEFEITHLNLNDQSVEGIKLKGQAVFSVQYHPEGAPGPHDSRYLFDDFVDLIDTHKI